MPKVISFLLFLLIVFSSYIVPEKALALEECPDGYFGEEKALDAKQNPRDCPSNTFCYVTRTDVGPTIYACYQEKDPSGSTSVNPPANLGGGETAPAFNAPGVNCSFTPKEIKRGEVVKLSASGLKKNTTYRLIVKNNSLVNLIKSDNNGRIETTFNPLAADNTIGSTGDGSQGAFTASLLEPPTKLQCRSEAIKMVNVISGDKKYYTCDSGAKACRETINLASDATEDKASCDQACATYGKTFAPAKNELIITAKSCNPAAKQGEPNACSKAMGQPCGDIEGQAINEGRGLANIKEGRGISGKPTGILTAIGCIPTEPKALVEGIVRFVSLASGGIAFLIMVFGAFRMITAVGNPDSIKAGREQFISAVYGLLFIIFSVLLLQFIGVDILGIPGFSR